MKNFLKPEKGLPPNLSEHVANSVSDYRRDQLTRELQKHAEGVEDSGHHVLASYSGGGISKLGQVTNSASAGSGSWRGGHGDMAQMAPESYSPLWLNSNLNLPRDQATINAWCRAFYALNPMVSNAINLHSTYPISKLQIRCPDKRVENHFNEMIEEIDLVNVCIQLAQEYWLLGEAFVYAELDERTAKWSRLLIQNPDYIVVERTVNSSEPNIMLRPDENLRRIVNSNKARDLEQKRQLGSNIIEYVKRGKNIPLDNFYISHLARKTSPYAVRGTGLPVTVFRQLMLMDRLRESKFVQADSMINPLTLVKVGGPDYKPLPADLETWRNIFEQGAANKDMKIFTHEAVTVEKIGSGSGIYDTSADITQLIKEIYIGLMAPQVLMDGGADTTYANGGVALDVLRQRYMSFRNLLSSWLKRKIFAPISKINEFYNYHEKEKILIVPEIDWNHMSLFDAGDYISSLKELATADPKTKRASVQTLYRSLGLEYEEEVRKIRREDIQDAIRAKEIASLAKIPLNELRTLGDDEEIAEVVENPVPGEDGSDAGSGAPAAPGGPSGDLGGLGGPLPGEMPPPPPPAG